MKVLDLQCANAHVFEGWFADEAAFQRQLSGGFLQCPVCASAAVHKLLSAPRIQRSAAPTSPSVEPPTAGVENPGQAQAEWLQRARDMVAHAENVGERFAAEARAMHEGVQASRSIRGVASAEQARELLSDGILVLPLPSVLSDTLH